MRRPWRWTRRASGSPRRRRRAALRGLRRAAQARRRALRRAAAVAAIERAAALAAAADLLLCVGSSLEVHPVAGLPELTLGAGGALALVTAGPTPTTAPRRSSSAATWSRSSTPCSPRSERAVEPDASGATSRRSARQGLVRPYGGRDAAAPNVLPASGGRIAREAQRPPAAVASARSRAITPAGREPGAGPGAAGVPMHAAAAPATCGRGLARAVVGRGAAAELGETTQVPGRGDGVRRGGRRRRRSSRRRRSGRRPRPSCTPAPCPWRPGGRPCRSSP